MTISTSVVMKKISFGNDLFIIREPDKLIDSASEPLSPADA